MLRRMMCVLLMAMVLPALGLRGAAVSETGSIRVTLEWKGEGVSDGEVMLYRVGEPIPEGYRLDEAFGGGIVTGEDALSPALAQWLAEQAGEAGIPRILDADGTAVFSQLEEGLYLLVQSEPAEGFYPMEAFLVTLPSEGQSQAEAAPELRKLPEEPPKTGQHPAPLVGAMILVFSAVALLICLDSKTKGK